MFNSPLARRYILLTVAFATCLTLLITIAEVFYVYSGQREDIVDIHNEIANLAVPTITQALWSFNTEIIETTLQSIVANGGVDYIQLSSENYNLVFGLSNEYAISSLFDVEMTFKDTPQYLGNIEFKTSLDPALFKTLKIALIRLLVNFTKTSAVVIFSMFVFHNLVNKHLVMFADTVKSYGVINPDIPPLEVKRSAFAQQQSNELDELASAFNIARAELAIRLRQREKALSEVRAQEETHRQQLHRIDSLMQNVRQYVSFFSCDGSLFYSSAYDLSDNHGAEALLHKKYVSEKHTVAFAKSLNIDAIPMSASRTDNHSHIIQFELDDKKNKWTLSIVIGNDSAQAMLLSDITEISRQKQIFMATKRVAAIGTITASVAHELNNGLAVMKGRTELLSQWSQLHFEKVPLKHDVDRQLIDSIAEIHKEIDHLTATSRVILGFSTNSATADVAIHPISDLGDLAKQVISDFVSNGKISHVSMQLEGFISIDLTQFLSSLRNLIKNSNEATTPGESIEVIFRMPTDHEIRKADLNQRENFMAIDIIDEGIGINEEMQNRLFTPFASTKSNGSGTGLGLWYVHNFIESYDGTITYQANTPKGSHFTIYLPASYRTDNASWKSSSHDDFSQNVLNQKIPAGGRILVIEDNMDMMEILKTYLEHQSYSVVACHSIADAMALLNNSEQFDGLISDLNLPDGLGTSVLKHYELINGKGPRILMTGSLSLEDEERKMLDQVIFLSKPFTLNALNQIISNSSADRITDKQAPMNVQT